VTGREKVRSGAVRPVRLVLPLFLALLALATVGLPHAAAQAAPAALEADGVRVVYWPGYEDLAGRTLAVARTPLNLPGMRYEPHLVAGTIYLAPSPAVWDSLTGGRVPDW
jgi:hypothetical protein